MSFEKIRNNSGNDDFSDEYITVIVTSYFDSNFVKIIKKENKLRRNRVTHDAGSTINSTTLTLQQGVSKTMDSIFKDKELILNDTNTISVLKVRQGLILLHDYLPNV